MRITQAIVLAAALLATYPAAAQVSTPQKAVAPKPKATTADQKPNAGRLPVPSAEKLVLLVRLSLLTLNDALQTGNYTVLRDRAGPSFSRNNTAAQLGRIFAQLENQNLDLSAVAMQIPTLTAAEVSDTQPLLHIAGSFPGQAGPLSFDLTYEASAGHWRLFGISVSELPAAVAGAQAKPTNPAKETKSGKP
ncbi:hypothetical protein [Hyphomicrobium sp.]|uniref:hypothetical protein n=1 Tax=Hyphomicrobium sp. TaxID=82 RepID=UPI000FA54D88|nr:hypothetical protein [Hyphomicrobium sp.]RUP10688.1 MAG: hypothetical protein EKK38_04010 [Hyphomicrobium sp.]